MEINPNSILFYIIHYTLHFKIDVANYIILFVYYVYYIILHDYYYYYYYYFADVVIIVDIILHYNRVVSHFLHSILCN